MYKIGDILYNKKTEKFSTVRKIITGDGSYTLKVPIITLDNENIAENDVDWMIYNDYKEELKSNLNKYNNYNDVFSHNEKREKIENKIWAFVDKSEKSVKDMTIDDMFNCVKILKDEMWHLRFTWINIFMKEIDNRLKEFEDEMMK